MRKSSLLGVLLGMMVLALAACSKKEEKPEPKAELPAAPAVTPSPVSAAPPEVHDLLKPETRELKETKPGCKGDDCATVDAKWLVFAQDPALTRLVEHELVALGTDKKVATLPDFAKTYLKTADRRWSIVLEAKLRRQTGNYVALDLDVYDYTGGAHGNPANQILNYNRGTQKALTLKDVLLPGSEARFQAAAKTAWQRWAEPQLKDDPSYLQNWPYSATENFTLAKNGVVLKYSAYAIAPYAAGEPEITIPYAELNGVIRPEWVLVR